MKRLKRSPATPKGCTNIHSLPLSGIFMERDVWPKSSVWCIANHVIYGLQKVYHAEVLNTEKQVS